MLSLIDNFLNRFTMYRLVLYYLRMLIGVAAVFGFFGLLPINPANLAFTSLLIVGVCIGVNWIFAKGFGATENTESVYITGLILALIIAPIGPTDYVGVGFVVFASTWAMASKYIFALGRKHLFNPAAFGVALASIVLGQSANWWVAGNLPLLPFVLIGGVLIVRKLIRTDLVLSFSVVALATIVLTTHAGAVTALTQTLIETPFFFLAFVMLTEPLTMPPSRAMRIIYAAIVGLLFAPNTHLGSYYFTPEVALLIGNLFSYLVSPKGRLELKLVEKNALAEGTNEFVFVPDRVLRFLPGQYMEVMLGHRFPDNRGNRRFFTIASSPTEKDMRFGVKFYSAASSFKRALGEMKVGDTISASQLAGDFVLPKDPDKKLVFLAGGIGVTPFRSMAQYLIDTKDHRSVTLLYSNKTASEIAYKDIFDKAEKAIGMKTVYALTKEANPIAGTYAGMIDRTLISREVPDYKKSMFYISGPHSMVEAFKKTLREMGVSPLNIKTDFFPGFA